MDNVLDKMVASCSKICDLFAIILNNNISSTFYQFKRNIYDSILNSEKKVEFSSCREILSTENKVKIVCAVWDVQREEVGRVCNYTVEKKQTPNSKSKLN